MAVSYTTKLTSTFTHPVCLCYRMPKGADGKANPVLEINLRARELNLDVGFPSVEHFEEFKRQNESLINSKRILIGDSKGAAAEKLNAEHSKKVAEVAKGKVNQIVEQLAEASEERVSIEVEKEERNTKSRRK